MKGNDTKVIDNSGLLHFDHLIEVISDAILVINKNGIILYANPVAETLLRTQHKDLRGEMFGFPLVEGNTAELHIYKNGKKISVEMKVQRLEWQGENCFLASLRDISGRVKADEERAHLAAAVRHAAEGIFITDKHGSIQYVNPAFEKISGFTKRELSGADVNDVPAFGTLWSKRDQNNMWQGRISGSNKNGRHLETSASISPIFNKENDLYGYVALVRDITHQLTMEKQLRQAQKMEAIGTLAGGIAHDFNNILMAIIGYTDLTLNTFQENKEILFNLTNVLNSAYRARDLVKQILTFSKQHEEEKKILNPSSLLKESLRFLRASLPSSINIVHFIQPGIKSILADSTQLYQVIMNLCTNAADAMQDKGGELNITLRNIIPDTQFTRAHPELKPGDYITLSVSDTGCGIDPQIIDKIFEPYFTTKQNNQGSGLGLSVVHGILKSYGGIITVSSEPGKGAVFTLFLPAFKTGEPLPENEVIPPVGGETILFIDDEEILAELGRRMLSSLGYSVTSKTDSRQALETFRQSPQGFDLVITDLTMPHLAGDDLALAMLSIRPDIPIILCTGYHEKISQAKSVSLGIKAFISKPLVMNELGSIISRVLERKTSIHG